MMQTKEYKRKIVIAIMAGLVEVVIMAILFYNIDMNTKDSFFIRLLPFILLLASVLCFGYAINIIIKALNPRTIKNLIDKEVSEERIKILKEFEKKNENESKSNNEDKSLQEKIKGILPKGNFKNIDPFIERLLKNIINNLEMVQGIAYLKDETSENYNFIKGFALTSDKDIPAFKAGENLNGQAVENRKVMIVDDIPENYFPIESGLGQAKPKQIIIVPVSVKNDVIAVLEMASFKKHQEIEKIIDALSNEISTKLEQIIKS